MQTRMSTVVESPPQPGVRVMSVLDEGSGISVTFYREQGRGPWQVVDSCRWSCTPWVGGQNAVIPPWLGTKMYSRPLTTAEEHNLSAAANDTEVWALLDSLNALEYHCLVLTPNPNRGQDENLS